MARLWFERGEWEALKEAAERVPVEERSPELRSALKGIDATLGALGCLDAAFGPLSEDAARDIREELDSQNH